MNKNNSFTDWESFFYPPPNHSTLVNNFNIRDPQRLRQLEYEITENKESYLATNPLYIQKTFDIEHLRQIHKFLFEDIYPWAGQLRSVDMAKNPTYFAKWDREMIDHLEDGLSIIQSTQWKSISIIDFTDSIANIFARINFAHPFREGNGRTTRIFLADVASQSPFSLNFDNVDKNMWIAASINSIPHEFNKYDNLILLKSVFYKISSRRNNSNDSNQLRNNRLFETSMINNINPPSLGFSR